MVTRHRTEYILDADDRTGKAFNSADKSMKQLGKQAALLAAGLAAAGAAAVAIVRDQAEATRSTRAYSDALGVSIETMSQLEFAFGTVGIQADKTGDILKDVSEKIGDAYANQGGEAKEALDNLGISVERIAQLSADQQLLVIAQGLDQLQTRGEKVQVLEAIANDASLLLPLLEDNAAGLAELAAEADKTGRTLTELEASAIEKADRALHKLDASFIGLKQTMAVEMAEPMAQTIEWFNAWLPSAMSRAKQWVDNLSAGWSALKRAFSGEEGEKSFGTLLAEEINKINEANLQYDAQRETTLTADQQRRTDMFEQQYSIELEMLWRHEQQMNQVLEKSSFRRLQFQHKTWQAQTKMVFGELEAVTRGVAQNSRTMFELNKAAGIANAIINTHEGVSETMSKYPWPLAGVMAGLHLAAGMAHVRAISSSSFGSGSAPSISGGGGAAPVAPLATELPGVGQGEPAAAAPQIQVFIEGSAIGNEQVREVVIEAVETAIDNDQLRL